MCRHAALNHTLGSLHRRLSRLALLCVCRNELTGALLYIRHGFGRPDQRNARPTLYCLDLERITVRELSHRSRLQRADRRIAVRVHEFCGLCDLSTIDNKGHRALQLRFETVPRLESRFCACFAATLFQSAGWHVNSHSLKLSSATRAEAPLVMVRLQTEKLVPQPQAAVAFGFLILNDVLNRSLT